MSKNLKARREQNLTHLVRLDSAKTSGWQLRIPAWHFLGPASEYFADGVYGSESAALVAARARRDAVFAQQGRPLLPSTRVSNSRNTSGTVGISFCTDRKGRARPHFYWVAYWSPPGQGQLRKRFSVQRLGYIGAWQAALDLRQTKTGEPLGDFQLAQARLHCLQMWPVFIQARP